ncbi:MAG TPA: amidohydrolase family protein [Thermoanaerobaculia bacterium]|jgi:imidazolonepropionase-like amidohydrolase
MPWMKRLVPFALCLLFFVGPAHPQTGPVTAVRCGRLIDVKAGRAVPNAVILIENGRITAAGPELKVPSGARVIDLGSATVLPGLIDVHTHLLLSFDPDNPDEDGGTLSTLGLGTTRRALLGAANAREMLEAGFTTVRDLGNSGRNGDVALRDAIGKGWVPGPRMQISTRALSPLGGQFEQLSTQFPGLTADEYAEVTGVEEARRAVRQALVDGATVIKVIVNNNASTLTLDEMKAIVEEAHRSGIKVAAHAIGDEPTRTAAQAGVDSIEHAYVVPDEVLRLMAEKKIYLVPTDYPIDYFLRLSRVHLKTPEEEKQAREGLEQTVARSRDRLARALKAGVPVAAGSDEYFAIPGQTRGETAREMFRAYAAAGMKPLDILRAATIDAATLLGWEKRLGSLEPGKYADLIAVPGDPLEDAGQMEKVGFVMKGGVVVRDALMKR